MTAGPQLPHATTRNLCDVLGISLVGVERAEARLARRDEIDAVIAEQTQRWEAADIVAKLQARGVPAIVVYLDSEIFAHPEFTGGNFLEEVSHPDTGTRLYPGPLWRSSNRPMSIRKPHYGLGEDNHEVLCGRIGWSEETFARMLEKQVIGTKYTFWPPWPRETRPGEESATKELG